MLCECKFDGMSTFFNDHVVQGITSVLATDEHRGLLETAAQKCGAHFGLLPSIASLQSSLHGSKEDGRAPIEQVVADAQKISSSIRGTDVTPQSIKYFILFSMLLLEGSTINQSQ